MAAMLLSKQSLGSYILSISSGICRNPLRSIYSLYHQWKWVDSPTTVKVIVRKGEKRLAYVATYLKKIAVYGRMVAPYELKGATDSIMFAVYYPTRANNTPSGCRLWVIHCPFWLINGNAMTIWLNILKQNAYKT